MASGSSSWREHKSLVTQVGYHYRFVGAFKEAARLVRSGALGEIHHVRAEAYGPVVLRRKGATWRSAKNEGGGALYDYACHAIDLVNFIVGTPTAVGRRRPPQRLLARRRRRGLRHASTFAGGASGQLCVNWSDESFRKMSTKISVWGTNGRVTADRQECQLYLRETHDALPGVGTGWTVRYTTDLSDEVWFYLRGEEYSAQIDYFAESVENAPPRRREFVRVRARYRSRGRDDARRRGGDGRMRRRRRRPRKTVWSRLFG